MQNILNQSHVSMGLDMPTCTVFNRICLYVCYVSICEIMLYVFACLLMSRN